MNRLSIILLALLAIACNAPKIAITNPDDYNKYLNENLENEKLEFARKELAFWSEKFEKAPDQNTYLSKMASANNQLFEITGHIDYLNTAANQLAKANEKRGFKSSSLLRALAKTRITQHRFREANECLVKAEMIGEQKEATQKMLFDVAMELGNYHLAEKFLKEAKDKEEFDYLIRLAKWYDHKGNTLAAIDQLEVAAIKADDENLKLWIYSNLADFYGHVGEIKNSYKHYLMSLEIDPNYVYALKGIAWIAFSHEKNAEEAERIISYIAHKHEAPDYILFRAEIAKYRGEKGKEESMISEFIAHVSKSEYGDMYNAYLVSLSENEPKRALELALREVANRPTPQSYQLLSWAYCQNGDKSKALQIADGRVKDQTFEPKSLIRLAEVYKLNGKTDEVTGLRNELQGAYFEVGPNLKETIERL